MLGELSGSLAHELNQPLSAILSNAQAAQRILHKGPAEPGQLQSILADIVENDRRAGEIIRHLRSMLRKEHVECCPLDMNGVVDDALIERAATGLGAGANDQGAAVGDGGAFVDDGIFVEPCGRRIPNNPIDEDFMASQIKGHGSPFRC